VPSPGAPPAVDIELDGVRYDDEVEVVEEFSGERTHVERRCLACAGEFVEFDDDAQPPASYAEAWGRHGGRCRGTRDPDVWSWCRGPIGEGCLDMPRQGVKVFFKDRRGPNATPPTGVERRNR
jgi:hypothetical protein